MLARGGAAALRLALGLPWERLWHPVRRASAWVMARPVWSVIAVLLLAQWLVVGAVAVVAQHNGVYYYTGGDATWYWTSSWVLAHGHVPQGVISYGYPFLLAPLAAIAGPSMIAGLPLAICLNLLVLWPIALLCVYGIAKALGGRGFAYLVTLTWTVFPLAAVPYFYHRYHVRYIDQNLPSSLGLTVTGDFPSLVVLLVAAYFTLRALSERTLRSVVMAGAITGLAATVKPANLVFLPAPLAALAIARRPRELVIFCAAFLPALGGLALWKYRGLGYVPAFHRSAAALALGASTAPVASLDWHRYIHLDWRHLKDNMYYIREFTWSLRLITWALIAGLIGLARRSAPVAVLIGGWLACFIVLKGTNSGINVKDGSFFRYLAPAFPAFFLGLAAIVLLVPVLGRRLVATAKLQSPRPFGRRGGIALLAVAGIALLVPVLTVAAMKPLTTPHAADVPSLDQYVPTNAFGLTLERRGGTVALSWPAQSASGSRPLYAVFRESQDQLGCTLKRHAAAACIFVLLNRYDTPLEPISLSRRTRLVDRPLPGHWIYRVVATISPHGPRVGGDFFLVSRAATVDVSR
jgi:hypothetical protein